MIRNKEVISRRVGRGGAIGANASPPRAEKVRLYRAIGHQRWIFSSNFSTDAAFHSVENISEVADHL